MKYFYSALMLFGGLASLVGIASLIGWLLAKLHDFEGDFDNNHIKYRKFKIFMQEKILPWVVGIIMIVLFLFLLVACYFSILKNF